MAKWVSDMNPKKPHSGTQTPKRTNGQGNTNAKKTYNSQLKCRIQMYIHIHNTYKTTEKKGKKTKRDETRKYEIDQRENGITNPKTSMHADEFILKFY